VNKTGIVGYDLAYGDLHTAVFYERALARALRFVASEAWATDMLTLDHVSRLIEGEVVLDLHKPDMEGLVMDLSHACISITLQRRAGASPMLTVDVHAGSRQAVRLEVARLKELLPPADAPPADHIQVAFWYRGPRGPARIQRTLAATAWAKSKANYASETQRALGPLMTDAGNVIARGRLLLMHGPPGTGKTSALRIMALENRASISIEYVLDPESLFGRDAAYFASVLFGNEHENGETTPPITRMLVLEDCDELLSADAKERAGQGLARLLNLVDGLIGQGLKIAVLITTNESLGAFHPAVMRPGRCGAVVAFELFGREEATEWLRRHDESLEAPGRVSLADLFAIRDGHRPTSAPAPRPREPIGFAGTGQTRAASSR
jgi:Domain of unknown function (DUF5925)/ATPase family associated with various cellular activities (AAA)